MEFNLDRFANDLQKWQDNLSLREMAALVGVSASTLSRISLGKMPSLEAFTKLCDACELNPSAYFQSDKEREYMKWIDNEPS